MSLTPTDDDILLNRAGRMTDGQRGIVLAQAYGSLGCAGLFLLVSLPLLLLGLSRVSGALAGQFFDVFDSLTPLVAAILLIAVTIVIGRAAYMKMRDGFSGVVERDCGIVTTTTQRTGASITPTAYLVVDGVRQYSTTTITLRGIEEGLRYCIYYAPRTRTTISIEGLE
jgi:hypothetical protein